MSASGTVKWKYAGLGPTISSPFIYNDLVYAAGEKGMVVALRLKDGTKVWEYRTSGAIKSSPVATGGRLFVASYDGHVYAFK